MITDREKETFCNQFAMTLTKQYKMKELSYIVGGLRGIWEFEGTEYEITFKPLEPKPEVL